MKKLVTMACALAAGMAMAQVESANTVGFTTIPIEEGQYILIGTQFESVGATGATAGQIALSDLISMDGVDACAYDDMYDDAAEIDTLVDGAYVSYFYISDAYGENNAIVTAWADEDGNAIDESTVLSLGEGFWFVANSAESGASIQVKGQVTSGTSKTISFPGNKTYAIMCNPLPVDTALSDVVTAGVEACAYDDMYDDAAEIDTLVNGAYVSFFYISDAYGENNAIVTAWADEDGNAAEGINIEAGASFWIVSPDAGSLTFSL